MKTKERNTFNIKVIVEYNNVHRPGTGEPVERIVKYEDTAGNRLILKKDELTQEGVFDGKELLDEFMKKCFKRHLEVIHDANPREITNTDDFAKACAEPYKPTIQY